MLLIFPACSCNYFCPVPAKFHNSIDIRNHAKKQHHESIFQPLGIKYLDALDFIFITPAPAFIASRWHPRNSKYKVTLHTLTIVCVLCTVCIDFYLAISPVDLRLKHHSQTLLLSSALSCRIQFRARAPKC